MSIPEDPVDPVLEQLKGLREAFDAKIRYDEASERRIESMSEELAEYRQDFHLKLLRPMLLDLIAMYDDLTQVLAAADCPPMTSKHLEFFRGSVEQVLARNGVEPFKVDGVMLDRTHQKVVRVTETPNPELDRQVENRLRPGFFMNGKVLRPEWVSVYRYTGGLAADLARSPAQTTSELPAETADPAQPPPHADEGASS
jgi:molecular chaperone GrpE (heat shock protein)